MARKRKPSASGMQLSSGAICLIAQLCWLVGIALAQYVESLASLEERRGLAYSSAGHDGAKISRVAKPHARTSPRRLLQELSARRRMPLLRRRQLQIARFFCGR
jgi:hypothetical protein